jgi:hypothetical protein
MYMTAELIRQQHQRQIEEASQVRLALQIRALRRADRRAHRAEARLLKARRVAARRHAELQS